MGIDDSEDSDEEGERDEEREEEEQEEDEHFDKLSFRAVSDGKYVPSYDAIKQ